MIPRMKYFTVDLIRESASAPGVVSSAWKHAVDAYWKEVELNRDGFPPGLQEIVRTGLHDAHIEEIVRESDSLLLRLGVLGPTPRGENDEMMCVVYRHIRHVAAIGVRLEKPDEARQLDLSEIVEGFWLYDEVERVNDHFEHRVIVELAHDALAILGVQFADVECTVSTTP